MFLHYTRAMPLSIGEKRSIISEKMQEYQRKYAKKYSHTASCEEKDTSNLEEKCYETLILII